MDLDLVHGTLILTLKILDTGMTMKAFSKEPGLLMMIYHSKLQLAILQVSGTPLMSLLDFGIRIKKALEDTGRKMTALTQALGNMDLIKTLEIGLMMTTLNKEVGCQMRSSQWPD